MGSTFSYDPGIMSKDLIVFENNHSTLQLNGATLHTTLTGMNLAGGTLLITQSHLWKQKDPLESMRV